MHICGHMNIAVGCTLRYQVVAPSAAFTFNVLVNTGPEQRLLSETIRCSPGGPDRNRSDLKGGAGAQGRGSSRTSTSGRVTSIGLAISPSPNATRTHA